MSKRGRIQMKMVLASLPGRSNSLVRPCVATVCGEFGVATCRCGAWRIVLGHVAVVVVSLNFLGDDQRLST